MRTEATPSACPGSNCWPSPCRERSMCTNLEPTASSSGVRARAFTFTPERCPAGTRVQVKLPSGWAFEASTAPLLQRRSPRRWVRIFSGVTLTTCAVSVRMAPLGPRLARRGCSSTAG
jgi:hypothetical protein